MEWYRKVMPVTLQGEEHSRRMEASVDKGHDCLTGRVGGENIFGSRFTVNRKTEEQKQLFAGLGRVKATVTVKNGTDVSIVLDKATEQGGTAALSPEALALDEGIQQAKDFLESPIFRRGLLIAKSIMEALGMQEFPRLRVFTVVFRNFPYSSLLALVKEEEREMPIHISWDITKAPVFLTATVVAEEILHALGIFNEQQDHDFVDRYIVAQAKEDDTDRYQRFLQEVEAARAHSIFPEEGYLESLERLRDVWLGKEIKVNDQMTVKLAARMVHHKYASIYKTDAPAVLVKMFYVHDAEARSDFDREKRNIKELYDIEGLRPYMPAYYSSGENKDEVYGFIVMEEIEGLSLDLWRTAAIESKDNEAPALNDVWMIMSEVLCILALFHQNEFIFTDFKLENIIRTTDGQLKFIDFGSVFSKRMYPLYRRFPLTLTPDTTEVLENMSLLQTGSGLDSKTDIFSAGVALYEMLTGCRVLPIHREDRPRILALTQKYSSRAMLRQRKVTLAPGYLLPISEHIERGHLLFSDFWHLWMEALEKAEGGFGSLSDKEKIRLLLERGTEFIRAGLADDFKFLADVIAEATILREHRVGTVQAFLEGMMAAVRADLKENNCFCERMEVFDEQLKFVDELPAQAVLRHPQTGHWVLRTPYAIQYSQGTAEHIFLKKTYEEAGQSFYHVVDEAEADQPDGQPLTLAMLNSVENVMYTLVGSESQEGKDLVKSKRPYKNALG
jgi:serine/threonine protein kinase